MNSIRYKFGHSSVIQMVLACVFVLFGLSVSAQNKAVPEAKVKKIAVSLHVTDDKGTPIVGADVVVGEGLIHAQTDKDGLVAFESRPADNVTVSAKGYEKESANALFYSANSEVSLSESLLFASQEDLIKLPYFTSFRRYSTDNRPVVKGAQLEKYPTTDVRNAFVGLVPGLEVSERDGQPGTQAEENLGSLVGGNFGAIRGYGDKVNFYARGTRPLVVIDDIEIDLNEMSIDPQEIESVTLIKDAVAKAMYGPRGTNGILFIKTKRGKKNDRILSVNVDMGMEFVDRMPRFVGGADYAMMNNEARRNVGRPELYSENAIAQYALNDPYNLRYPSNSYRDMLFKDSRMIRSMNVSSRGGNDKLQYFAYLGYTGEDDNFKMSAKEAVYNRFNARSNIDVNINEFMKLQFDFFANISLRTSPNYGYNSNFGADNTNDGELDMFEMNSLMEDMRSIAPIAFPVYAVNMDGSRRGYALSNAFSYGRNPVGALTSNGYYTEQNRMGNANVALDMDLNHLIKGLKSRTYLGFNVFNLVRIGKETDYDAFGLNVDKYDAWKAGDNTITDNDMWTRKRTATTMSSEGKLHDYYAMRFSAYETLTWDKKWGKHALNTGLTANMTRLIRNEVEEPFRTLNATLAAQYVYNERYILSSTINYAGASFYPSGKRYKPFPTVGAGWILSEERFMKNISWLNFLKIRGEFGILGSPDYQSYYNYDDKWSYGGINGFGKTNSGIGTSWMGSTNWAPNQGSYNRVANYDLTWATRTEITGGFEAQMFSNRLTMEFMYYNILRKGDIETVDNKYALYMGFQANPWVNNSSTRYFGGEGSVQWKDKIGNVKYNVGGMANIQRGRRLIVDELAYPANEQYRAQAGKLTGTIWGQNYVGRYATDAEAMAAVDQKFDPAASLRAGDLKYKDMNGDGSIDDRDAAPIGNSSPLLLFAINLGAEWKHFEFTLIGAGAAFFDYNMRGSAIYTTNAGDNNYSEWVRDNRGGAFPRLTYDNINSNNQTSSFWLRDGSYFKIQNVEIAYNFQLAKSSAIRAMRVFVHGANLLTISGIKELDPEGTSSGVTRYPMNKTVTAGVKITF